MKLDYWNFVWISYGIFILSLVMFLVINLVKLKKARLAQQQEKEVTNK